MSPPLCPEPCPSMTIDSFCLALLASRHPLHSFTSSVFVPHLLDLVLLVQIGVACFCSSRFAVVYSFLFFFLFFILHWCGTCALLFLLPPTAHLFVLFFSFLFCSISIYCQFSSCQTLDAPPQPLPPCPLRHCSASHLFKEILCRMNKVILNVGSDEIVAVVVAWLRPHRYLVAVS